MSFNSRVSWAERPPAGCAGACDLRNNSILDVNGYFAQ